MGQTRVDLQHLLEDLRDAYPGDLEETILTEIVANALDSGASRVETVSDAAERALLVIDDGSGMSRRELARYHDIASSSKSRGEGIGFAGVGIKLGLLVAEEVVTETRRKEVHVATRWHLAARQRAPWRWIEPPNWLARQGTAVRLKLHNALSPLLDTGYVETTLRRHFEPLLDGAFDAVLQEHYPRGVAFVVNGHALPRREARDERAAIAVRLPRKRKAAAFGYLERAPEALPEEQQGVAVSTLGKVIRRGWEWIGVNAAAPDRVGGLVEAPGLAAALTLNKGDFLRTGRRGVTYLAYRKAIQEAVSAQLAAWGEGRDREDSARRRAARPLERDLETVLFGLADDFPALSALVERRSGGQMRLPVSRDGAAAGLTPAVAVLVQEPGDTPGEAFTAAAPSVEGKDAEQPVPADAPARPAAQPTAAAPAATLPLGGGRAKRQPGRYGLSIDFEEGGADGELGRLMESTVWVNTTHPAYRRAVASRSEGYHIALTVGLALASLAVEPEAVRGFLTAFLERWGAALDRDGRRRQGRRRV